jgi:UDP:flavonoid glycosyltransferase YjiC (YdhE family)
MFDQWLQLRAAYGVAARANLLGYFRPDLLLAAVSPLLYPEPPLPTRPAPLFTGFWLEEHAGWQPDSELHAFLQRNPIVLSFSSQPLADPSAVLNLHARAALRLGRPLLVLCGWSGLTDADLASDVPRSEVLLRQFAPMRMVCRQAACAIIHGGIGSLADALLAGCPMLVEPHGGDQFLNARQVLRTGIGAAADKDCLTETNLAHLLAERVLTPDVRARAEALSARMRLEDGLSRACELIEGFCGGATCLPTAC